MFVHSSHADLPSVLFHHVAAAWHPAKAMIHKAGNRVEVLLWQVDTQFLVQIVDVDGRIDKELAPDFDNLANRALELVEDVANNLFEDVLAREKAGGAAEFIEHDGNLLLLVDHL